MDNKDISQFYKEERLFWVTDSTEDNEEIFTCLQDAEEYIEATKFGAPPRIRICVVRNAYQDERGEWNYDDFANTFSTVLSSDNENWDYITKEQRSIS